MDAMVTARMPEEKKRSGNRVIARAGKTPSGFIGEVYDYIIDEGKLPDLARSKPKGADDEERARLFDELVAGTVLDVPASFWEGAPSALSDDELLAAALEEQYGPLPRH